MSHAADRSVLATSRAGQSALAMSRGTLRSGGSR